jgi:hypothetical protein
MQYSLLMCGIFRVSNCGVFLDYGCLWTIHDLSRQYRVINPLHVEILNEMHSVVLHRSWRHKLQIVVGRDGRLNMFSVITPHIIAF